jgi:hypothetical protein
MHDSRPTKGGPSKNVEPRIDKYVLRPTAESLWAEIRNVVDGQHGWGDKEALELEARIVVGISKHRLTVCADIISACYSPTIMSRSLPYCQQDCKRDYSKWGIPHQDFAETEAERRYRGRY